MAVYKKITSIPVLPQRINKLEEIAYNLWWSWNPEALEIFKGIDPDLWDECKKNPMVFLRNINADKLKNAEKNSEYLKIYDDIVKKYNEYMNDENTWFNNNKTNNFNYLIAYFSAEYGLHEILPTYCGGLGILAGDHCKSASDLGLPFTAVGLLYKHGYFIQHINQDGIQEAKFINYDVSNLPVKVKKDNNGNVIIISIDFPGRTVYAKVWEVIIGRVNLFLLDTDIPQNISEDRAITSVLYGGNQELRISQEIILGIGGIKMLYTLGLNPTVFHMNEGHSAFCALELIRKYMQKNSMSFDEAKEIVTASTIFTTHTPVPAGSDRFPLTLIDKYFYEFYTSLKISREKFINLGRSENSKESDVFNMTILALKMSGKINGVSKLHGMVSRNIFNEIWPYLQEDEVPIGHITNGIHTVTWLNPLYKKLFDKYLGNNWINNVSNISIWNKVDEISNAELWEAHIINKRNMFAFLIKRLKEEKIRNKCGKNEIRKLDSILNPNALIISFARRFATYKRATLIFKDLERLKNIINTSGKPVQIIFAGKTHPADYPGQDLIKYIHDISHQEGFKGKIIFVENYDMKLAKHLIFGSDVWLNNPQKPLEASGTSGQKAAINGVINLSVLDGWWAEGYTGNNGWAIGDDECCYNDEFQDNIDADSLYDILENEIIPLFFTRNNNDIPDKWIEIMKNSIKSCTPVYSTMRMVQEYAQKYYFPIVEKQGVFSEETINKARELSQWKSYISHSWNTLKISHGETFNQEISLPAGKELQVCAKVKPGDINPKDLRVEVFYGKEDMNGNIETAETAELTLFDKNSEGDYEYRGNIYLKTAGDYKYTFRAIPYHPDLNNKFELGLVKWAE